ncbi:MAG TPA: RluA family pseudouridine synthase, partial [Lachnospiraceae bacterium]|nr:RluA family pseudouridine synthase [Lachnospiraceae bacterium]
THQIRVHMAHIGCPLPGDFLYNPDFSRIKRQALHAAALDFDHPVTGEALHFEAPLPEDMMKLLKSIGV